MRAHRSPRNCPVGLHQPYQFYFCSRDEGTGKYQVRSRSCDTWTMRPLGVGVCRMRHNRGHRQLCALPTHSGILNMTPGLCGPSGSEYSGILASGAVCRHLGTVHSAHTIGILMVGTWTMRPLGVGVRRQLCAFTIHSGIFNMTPGLCGPSGSEYSGCIAITPS